MMSTAPIFARDAQQAAELSGGIEVSSPPAAGFNRADAALVLAKRLGIPHTDDPKTLHGLLEHRFPGGYDGITSLSFHDQPLTLEVATVVLVWNAGWDVINYSAKLAEQIKAYADPRGFPYYGPGPTPRSIPFIAAAIGRGLLSASDIPRLREPLTRAQFDALIDRWERAKLFRPKPAPPYVITDADKEFATLDAKLLSPSQLIVIPHGYVKSGRLFPDGFPNPVFDLRGPSPRMIQGPHPLGTGYQDYFPLGGLQTTFTVALTVPADALHHQGQALLGSTDNHSSTVNAVGIWGASQSRAEGARVWGGFLTASSDRGPDRDAQLVGLEVDVTNHALDGVAPNASKVGIQVVGLGTKLNTNAIEILGADGGQWVNGILFAPRTIDSMGTLIGSSQPEPVRFGIDFATTRFTDAAIRLGMDAPLTFSVNNGTASVYGDSINQGHLVLRGGPDGVRIVNTSNSRNLLWIRDDGSIDPSSSLMRLYGSLFMAFGAGASLSLIGTIVMWIVFRRWRRTIDVKVAALTPAA